MMLMLIPILMLTLRKPDFYNNSFVAIALYSAPCASSASSASSSCAIYATNVA